MTPVSESFMVQEWGPRCGPPPVSGTMLPATSVAIRRDGSELVVTGDRRALRTDGCLDAMPTLFRETHSRDARSWRTRCATPAGDPRHAVINTAFFVAPGDDAISIAETGRYEFAIGTDRCIADVNRRASLSRIVAGGPLGSSRASGATPANPALSAAFKIDRSPQESGGDVDCSAPGSPARLEVRPSRKLLRLGETFGFRGVVVDARGCATGTAIRWAIGPITFQDGQPHAARPTIDGSGKLATPEADFADATFDVIATAAGKEVRASVQATSAGDIEALLEQSGLDSNGERAEPSIAMFATSSIGAPSTRAQDGASRRRLTFVTVVGGLAILLGLVAVIGARRARVGRQAERSAEERHKKTMREYQEQKRRRDEQHAEQLRAHATNLAIAQQQAAAAAARGADAGPLFCPSCRREFTGKSAFCPFDANRLVAIAGHEELLAGPAGSICPTCQRGFNPGVKVCPHDGEELIPSAAAAAAATSGSSAPPRGKICPTCGGRFQGSAAFCGKDGTQLVLLN